MTIKEKLLAAIADLELLDLGEEALVDILIGRIKTLESRLVVKHGENAREKELLKRDHEYLNDERKKLRTDPLYGAIREYYFLDGNGGRLCLKVMSGRNITLERYPGGKNYAQILPQVSPADFWSK